MEPKYRLSIIQVLIQQLLSYQKFRETIDERINSMSELRRELRILKEWDRQQEREAREAHLLKEAESKQNKSEDETSNENVNSKKSDVNKKPSKDLQNLRNYLKYLNEGRSKRFTNDAEVKQLILGSMPFQEMELHEIDEFRELQRELFREKLNELRKQIFVMQGKNVFYLIYYFPTKHSEFWVRSFLKEGHNQG